MSGQGQDSGAIAFIDLDPAAVRHLLRALERHRDAMRLNATPVPDALLDLEDRLRRRQEGSAVAAKPLPVQPAAERLVDARDAAATLGVSVSTVKRLVAAGDLASVSVGRSRRIRHRDLLAYIARLPRAATVRGRSS